MGGHIHGNLIYWWFHIGDSHTRGEKNRVRSVSLHVWEMEILFLRDGPIPVNLKFLMYGADSRGATHAAVADLGKILQISACVIFPGPYPRFA